MVASAPAAMGTTTTAAVAATTVLSGCWNWRESKTDENGKCNQGFEKTESAHNPYLHTNVAIQPSEVSMRKDSRSFT